MKRCLAPRMPISIVTIVAALPQHDDAGGMPRANRARPRRLALIDQRRVMDVVFRQDRTLAS